MYNSSMEAESLVGVIEDSLLRNDYKTADFDAKKALEYAFEQGRKSLSLRVTSPPRKDGVLVRNEMYQILKARSEELKEGV